MKQLFSTLSHSTRRYLSALTLLFLFSACTQTPTPSNNQNNAIEISDEEGNNLTAQAVPTNGLTGTYYNNMDFTGTQKIRYDANVNRNWGTAAPISGIANTTYSVRWTGQILPQYSQEYTFFVTSSGGARLMVNGQALVNNWTDHTSKVDSGKVTLQANVKYDIRLEFFRNTSNPAVIKLEWQSASRTKQVVPQVRLYPIQENTRIAWNTVKDLIAITSNNVVPRLDAADTFVQGTGVTFTVPLANQAGRIYSVFKNSKLLYGILELYQNGKLIVIDLRLNKSVDFGDPSQYYDLDATNDLAQRTLYKNKLLESFSYKSSSRIKAQAVIGNLCPTCVALYEVYLVDDAILAFEVAKFTAYYGLDVAYCIANIASNPANSVKACVEALALALVKDVVFAGYNPQTVLAAIIDAANKASVSLLEWQQCIETAQCNPKISNPTPNPLKLEARVGETASGQVRVRNIGYFSLPISISNSQSWLTVASSGFDLAGLLPENTDLVLSISALCEQVGITFGTVIVGSTLPILDPTYQEQKTIDVELKCIGEPKIQADSKSWSLPINQSLPQPDNIVIKNEGTDVLKITNFNYQVGSLGTASITPTLPPASLVAPLEIPAGDSRSIPVTAACGSTVGTLTGTITISSNAVPNSLSVGVSLECKALPVTKKINMGFIALTGVVRTNFANSPGDCMSYSNYTYQVWVGVSAAISNTGAQQAVKSTSGTFTTSVLTCSQANIEIQKKEWESHQQGLKTEFIENKWKSMVTSNVTYPSTSPELQFLSTTSHTPCGSTEWTVPVPPNTYFEWSSCLPTTVTY